MAGFLFDDLHEPGSYGAVAAHSQFIDRLRQDGGSEEVEDFVQQFAPLRRQAICQLPHHPVVGGLIPVAQAQGKKLFHRLRLQPAEQRYLGRRFRRRATLQALAEVDDRLGARSADHFQQPFPLNPVHAPRSAAGHLIDRGVRHTPQDLHQAFRKGGSVQGFFNEIGQGVPRLDTRPEESCQFRLTLLQRLPSRPALPGRPRIGGVPRLRG